MLQFPLIHPPLLEALGTAGHGSRVLIADGNFPYSTIIRERVAVVHLNLSPGIVTADQVLPPVMASLPVSTATVMTMDNGERPDVFDLYQRLLSPAIPIDSVGRQDFYDLCAGPEVAVVIVTGDVRPYANILITIGVVAA